MRRELTQRGWRAGVAVGLLGVVGLVCSPHLRFFVRPDPPLLLEVREDIRAFKDLGAWPVAHGHFLNEGFLRCASERWADSGWCVPPAAEGTLDYVLPEVVGSEGLLLRLTFFRRDPRAHSRLLVLRQADPRPRLTFENVHFADQRLDLSGVLDGEGGRIVLRFEGDNPTTTSDIIVQQVESRFFGEPLPTPPRLPAMALAVLALGICLLPLMSWRCLVPLWAIVTLGFALRYYALTQALFLPLDWDATGYHVLAQRMALFTDAGFFSAQFAMREPLFILVVKAALWLLGDSETHVRLVSLFGSLLAILLAYRVAGKLFGTRLALLGALAMAVALPLVRESVRGLRLETELVLLLVFVEVAFLGTVKRPWVRAGLTGLLAGLLGLTRMTYLVTLAPLVPFAFLQGRFSRPWVATGFAALLMVGLQLPHRVNMYRLHGDPFWDTGEYAEWMAEAELTGHRGFSSPGELAPQPPTETRMTYGRYLFGLHTVPELAVGTVRGFWKAVRHMELVAFHRRVARLTGLHWTIADVGFQLVGVMGLLLAFAKPAFRWMPLTFLVLLLPISFLYDRGVIEPWRHTYQAFPWIVLGVLLVCSQVAQTYRRVVLRT